jgi:hypothetical protein
MTIRSSASRTGRINAWLSARLAIKEGVAMRPIVA